MREANNPAVLVTMIAGLAIASCEQPRAPAATDGGSDTVVPVELPGTDTVDSLAADRDRLREVMRECRNDDPDTYREICAMASKAARRRFMGDGKPKYTPEPVDLFPATPDTLPAAPADKNAQTADRPE